MSLDPTLPRFNAVAFKELQKDLDSLSTQIIAYKTQQRKIDRLANLALTTFAILIVKLLWNKVSGPGFKIALFSSSSIILGLFDLAVGSGTLWYWIDKTNKTKQIADEITRLSGITRRTFYGEITERKQDDVTAPEVLVSIQENLRPIIKETVPIEKDYILIATYQCTMEGSTAETFKFFTKKMRDNFLEIKATVATWRSYYSELYHADPNTRKSATMQVIASQCIQELPATKIEDDISRYSCSSPSIMNPKNGSIGHSYLSGGTTAKVKNYSSPVEFRKLLVELRQYLDSLPKVKILAPFPVLEERK